MIGERRRPSVADSDHCADGPQTATAEGADLPRHESTRLLGIRLIAYLTNHVVSKVPSYTLRHAWYRHVVGVTVGAGAAVHLGLRLSFHGPGQVRRSSVAIGTGTRINRDCTLDARGPLQIGDHVSISPEVVILTADHDRNAAGFPLRHRGVVIEDRVWIGMRAMVLPGVRVGRGAVVAAGAVVSRDVAPLTVVAGVPALTVAIRRAEGLRYVLSKPPLLE